MKSNAPLIVVGLGVLLVLLSALWPILFPAERNWTQEKAERMTELSNTAHQLLYEAIRAKENPKPGGPDRREAQQKYDDAKAELDALQAEFESNRDAPKNSAAGMRWTGIAMVLIGGCWVMIAKGG